MDLLKPIADRQDQNDLLIVRSKPDDRQTRRLLPTIEVAVEVQHAYNFFNEALFGGMLPQCILTYTRKKHSLGYFSPDRFERSDGELLAEVALNAQYLALREDRNSLSTLVHEQVHVWRHYLAASSRSGPHRATGYHDRVWADRVEAIGLLPTDTGLPGGKRTGHRMTHYIILNGLFDQACGALLHTGFRINWHERLVFKSGPQSPEAPPEVNPGNDRVRFKCRGCALNAWAKPSARLTCTDCRRPMIGLGDASPSTALTLSNRRR